MEQVMLDMIPTGAKAVCHVSQYDIGRTIRFNLISGGAAYTLSGTETVKVYIKKPDGTTAERNIANTSSTYVDWVTGEGDCDQAGECECELVITSGTTVIGSKNFTVKIEEDPYNDQGVVTETAGPAIIAMFTTNVVDLLQEVKCSINPIQNGTPWIDSNEVNKVPYIKRAVAGTATRIGNHLYDKLVGGTVAFNQIRKNGNFTSIDGWSSTDSSLSVSNNTLIATLNSAVSVMEIYDRFSNRMDIIVDHKYLIIANVKCSKNITRVDHRGFIILNDKVPSIAANTAVQIALIGIATSNPMQDWYFYATFEAGDTLEMRKSMVIDLTQMFGSTIADYIYSLEQATAGAGVAWFKTLFPNDYYAYNAGELMSVKATAHVMKNASNTVIGNYALDSNLVLNGLFKLDANNKLYADGDTYESSGLVTRNIKTFNCATDDFTLTKNNSSDDTDYLYYFLRSDISSEAETTDIISSKFKTVNYAPTKQNGGTISLRVNPKVIYVNMYGLIQTNDAVTAQQWLVDNAVIFKYKKTPTTEQASPFTNPQVCDENGTEEYTDNRAVAIPVGHETYQANICPITGFDELNIKQSGQNTSEIAKLIKLEFDDTVYLAEVSCLNGVWKLKLLGKEVDLGDLTYTATGSLTSHMVNLSDARNDNGIIAVCDSYSNHGALSDWNQLLDSEFTIRYQTLRIHDNTELDATAFKSYVAGKKLVYELVTPIEITLDETEQFEALLGVNNVWHDGNGNTEVKYLYNA